MPHNALHHISKRKRIHEKKEVYPHPESFKRILDSSVYVVVVVNPLIATHQSYKIWAEHTAEGVSLLMFGFSIFASALLLLYGIVHKERLFIMMYSLWLLVNTSIVLGTILYN